jgi:uncharacterized protein
VAIINIFKKETIDLHQLPSGHVLDINVYSYDRDEQVSEELLGKTVYIQSSVHGAELQGNLVIHELHQILKQVKILGRIIMVPLANPLATNQKNGQNTQGRFNPVTGDNWNRNYTDVLSESQDVSGFSLKNFCVKNNSKKTSEIQKNFKSELKEALLKIKKSIMNKNGSSLNRIPNLTYQILASEADIVLDLHTGPCSTEYIYSPECQNENPRDLNFPFHLIIPNKFAGAMDEACFTPWHRLDLELIKEGQEFKNEFEAYTLELGSEELVSSKNARSQALRIAHYLVKRGVIEKLTSSMDDSIEFQKVQHWCLLKDYLSVNAPHGGIFEYLHQPGSFIKKGDILGRYIFVQHLDQNETVENMIAENDYYLINHNVSSSVHKGSNLFQLMENFKAYS